MLSQQVAVLLGHQRMQKQSAVGGKQGQDFLEQEVEDKGVGAGERGAARRGAAACADLL